MEKRDDRNQGETVERSLPENIVRIINEKGMKQCAVAERAGFSKQHFNDMVNGRKIIKPCDLLAISGVLGVTENDLYGMDSSMKEVV